MTAARLDVLDLEAVDYVRWHLRDDFGAIESRAGNVWAIHSEKPWAQIEKTLSRCWGIEFGIVQGFTLRKTTIMKNGMFNHVFAPRWGV